MRFTLVFRPSTTPDENAFLAINQLRMRSLYRRIVFASRFMGSIFERITFVVQWSINFPAQTGEI